jgi:tape measure domain-containing protein
MLGQEESHNVALNLGDVTFGLNANYQGLLEAQKALKSFGTDLDKFAKVAQQDAEAAGRAMSDFASKTDQASKSQNTFGAVIKQVHAAVSAYLGPLSHTANMISQFGKLTEGAVSGVAGFVGPLAIIGVVGLKSAEALVRAGAEMQKLDGIMTAATGSAYLASQQIDELGKLSLATGTEFTQSTEEFGRFEAAVMGAGGSAKTAMEAFKGMQDETAALRLPTEALSRGLLALQQMMTAGKVQAQELRQLYNAMPASLELMAKGLGENVQQLRAQVKAGLDSSKAIEALATEQEKAFGAQAKTNAETYTGALANLHTAWFTFLADMDKTLGVSAAVAQALNWVAQRIHDVDEFLKNLHGTVNAYMRVVEDSTKAVDDWADAHRNMKGVPQNITQEWLDQNQKNIEDWQKQLVVITTQMDKQQQLMQEAQQSGNRIFGLNPGSAAAYNNLHKSAAELADAITNAQDKQKELQKIFAEGLKADGFVDTTYKVDKMGQAIANAKTLIADLNKEYAAMLQGPNAFKQSQSDTAIDKQVESMQKSLEAAKVPLATVNSLLLQYKTALQGIALLKPAMAIEDEIQKQKDAYDDVLTSAKKYGEYLTQLKGLPTQSLMGIAATLGVVYTNTDDLAKAMSDLYEKAANAKALEKSYDDVNKKVDDLLYATNALTKSTQSALEYKADPALFKSLDEYEQYLITIEGLSQDAADAQIQYIKGVMVAYKNADDAAADLKTNGQIVTDALKGAFNDLGNAIENVFKTGKIQAQDFITILEDMLTKIMEAIVEQTILLPIEHALTSMITGGSSAILGAYPGSPAVAAKGLAYVNDNILALAKGGVIYGPTMLANGGAMAGEYGQAEAVVPLKRTSSGDLGVSMSGVGSAGVNVYVTNNAAPDAQVQVKQSKSGRGEIDLEIMITKAVAKDIQQGGNVYKSIGNMFDAGNRVSQR